MDHSKLKKLYDFRMLPMPEKLLELVVKTEEIDAELTEVSTRFLTIEPAEDEIREGDFVVIRTEQEKSEQDGGNSEEIEPEPGSIQINVGRHFYDAAWEESLIGKRIGDAVTLPARGDFQRGIITQIKRRSYPELTDALVARMELEGAFTIAEYRSYLEQRAVERTKQQKGRGLCAYVCKEIIRASRFEDLSEEIEAECETIKSRIRAVAEDNQIPYEEALAVQLPRQGMTPEEIEIFLRGLAEKELQQRLIGAALAEQNQMIFDRASYQKVVAEYIAMGMDSENIEQEFPYEMYMENIYSDYLNGCILAYFEKQYKVVYR